MIAKFLKLIYNILVHLIKIIVRLRRQMFNFIIPNISVLLSKRISLTTYPTCDQKTLITGLGNVEIGKNCAFGYKPGGFYRRGTIEIQPRYPHAIIKIGDRIVTNNNVFICAANRIEIGDYTLVGQYVTIMDFEAHGIPADKRRELGIIGEVIIGKNVWIGNNVIILKDSHIGENSIVAAGAMVSGTFPENVIIGGVPGKIIKSL
jgi:acetyltransferase-like isoleucine patch superfamily enzyme